MVNMKNCLVKENRCQILVVLVIEVTVFALLGIVCLIVQLCKTYVNVAVLHFTYSATRCLNISVENASE